MLNDHVPTYTLDDFLEAIEGQNMDVFSAYMDQLVTQNKLDTLNDPIKRPKYEEFGTILNWAVAYGTEEMVRILLDRHANIEQRCQKNDATPLIVAAHFGYLDMVKLLLEREANIYAEDNSFRTALQHALDFKKRNEKAYQPIIELLQNELLKKSKQNKGEHKSEEVTSVVKKERVTPESIKQFSLFTKLSDLKVSDTNKFKSTTAIMRKKPPATAANDDPIRLKQKYQNDWYVKSVKTRSNLNRTIYRATLEVVAQEFFRLFIPGHPKTRIVVDDNNNIYVASKKITGYQAFPAHENAIKLWEGGEYFGLGEVTLISLLLNEIDLRLGNLAFDIHNQLIKFDGDHCFSRLTTNNPRKPEDTITEKMISSLPLPEGYCPENWLGVMRKGKRVDDQEYSTSSNPDFRGEVNKALLRVVLLPDALIRQFINYYASEHTHLIFGEFMDRRNQMVDAAFQNKSFLSYLVSDQAQAEVESYTQYLSTFTTTRKNLIFESPKAAQAVLSAQFDSLKKRAHEIGHDDKQENTPLRPGSTHI